MKKIDMKIDSFLRGFSTQNDVLDGSSFVGA